MRFLHSQAETALNHIIEPDEQVLNERRSAAGAHSMAPAEPYAGDTAPLDQAGRIQEVALSRICLRPAHRRLVMDARSLTSLRSSIDAIELQRPLLVRPVGGGQYELVTGHRRLVVLQADGRETAPVEVREMTALDAALHAYADDHHHIPHKFWERALRIEEIRALLGAERGVPAGRVKNCEILAHLGIRKGNRSLDSLVSESLGALAVLTPAVLNLAEVERDDSRLALAVSRPVYREIRDAPDDRARAAIVYSAVHGHPPAWAPEADATPGFDVASVISTRWTPVSAVLEITWARVPPKHIRAVRKRARAALERLLSEPPLLLSLSAPATRASEPLPELTEDRTS